MRFSTIFLLFFRYQHSKKKYIYTNKIKKNSAFKLRFYVKNSQTLRKTIPYLESKIKQLLEGKTGFVCHIISFFFQKI